MYIDDLLTSDPIDVGYEYEVYTTSEGDAQVELCAIFYSPDTGAPRGITLSAST